MIWTGSGKIGPIKIALAGRFAVIELDVIRRWPPLENSYSFVHTFGLGLKWLRMDFEMYP
jgi:hypothetical protein